LRLFFAAGSVGFEAGHTSNRRNLSLIICLTQGVQSNTVPYIADWSRVWRFSMGRGKSKSSVTFSTTVAQ
jgi:hypothetical protein